MSRLLSSLRLPFVLIPTMIFLANPDSAMASASDSTLLPLIEVTMTRLTVARRVALVKWDLQVPIEDRRREESVLATIAEQPRPSNIERREVLEVYSDQIEANKLVQYSLHAQWHRLGGAPIEPRMSLEKDIRPQLDELQHKFLDALAVTKDLRVRPKCGEELAREIQVFSIRRALDPLYELALQRALARACRST